MSPHFTFLFINLPFLYMLFVNFKFSADGKTLFYE